MTTTSSKPALPPFCNDAKTPPPTNIGEHKAKLVIIEPLATVLAAIDANKEIRRVLYMLSKIAERRTLAQSSRSVTFAISGERRLVT